MKILIVEDDFISRSIMVKNLSPYGVCDVAVNGEEAIMSFNMAWDQGDPYDLITLDIMMPKMDGHDVLASIREIEAEKDIHGKAGVKVIMTTALSDRKNIMKAFKSQCEAYLTKPIDRKKLIEELQKLELIQP